MIKKVYLIILLDIEMKLILFPVPLYKKLHQMNVFAKYVDRNNKYMNWLWRLKSCSKLFFNIMNLIVYDYVSVIHY